MGPDDGSDGQGISWREGELSENAETFARSMYEVLNDGDVAAIDEHHSVDLDYYRSSDERGGREELKDDARMFLSAFPDFEATILDVFADDEARGRRHRSLRSRGTHAGTFETIPPTDQRVRAKGIGIAEFEDGEIVEFDLVFDNLGMLQDLGLIR